MATQPEPDRPTAIPQSWWWNGLAALAAAAVLPIIGHALRGDHPPCCAWDGLPVEPVYRVRVAAEGDAAQEFCSVRCAELWLERSGCRPVRIIVTDEATGEELDSSRACYVRSTVATSAVTGNRVHVFRTREDAQRHAAAAHGWPLTGSARPFAQTPLAARGSLTHDG
jgi:hypothetical protein